MYSRKLQATKATLSTCASFIIATTILIACNAKQTTQDTQPKQQVSSPTGSLLSLGSFRQFPNNNRRQQINEQQAYNAQHKQQFNPNYQDLNPQEPIGIYTINQYQPTLVTDHTKNVYTQTMREVLIELQQTMQAKSENFDQYFKQLLALSRKDLDSTFNTTYGELYKHNTEVFIQMFNSLDNYYINGRVRISTIMESFFACLYQKIFQVLNPAFSFPASYLKCATDQLAPLKPFGDVPEKLTQEIKDSFIAARTFIQALRAGVDVVNNVKSVGHSWQCLNLIEEKLLNPKQQQGQPQQALCQNSCESVMLRCIGKTNLDSLQAQWQKFVYAINKLANKLSASYNAFEVLDMTVSEAIMNFQDNGINITHQVFSKCGVPNYPLQSVNSNYHGDLYQPRQLRQRRESRSNSNYNYQHQRQPNYDMTRNQHNNNKHQQISSRSSSSAQATGTISSELQAISKKFPSLIEDIRKFMIGMTPFWSNLPGIICASGSKSNTATQNLQINAGNSTLKNKLQAPCPEDKLSSHDTNFDIRYRKDMEEQAKKLAAMTANIELALEGHEIDWSVEPLSMRLGNIPPVLTQTTVPHSIAITPPSPTLSDDLEANGDEIIEESGSGAPDEDPDAEDPEDNDADNPGSEEDETEDSGSNNSNFDKNSDNDEMKGLMGNSNHDSDIGVATNKIPPISNDVNTNMLDDPTSSQLSPNNSAASSSKLVENFVLMPVMAGIILALIVNLQSYQYRF